MHAGQAGWCALRRCVAAAALALAAQVAGSAHAGEEPAASGRRLELSMRPKAGDVIRLELRKEHERQMPNQPPQRSANLLRVTIEVLESGPQGTVVRWSHLRPETAPSQNAGTSFADAESIWELVQEIRYELEFDPGGEFVQLRNYDEVRPLVDRMLAQMEAVLARRGDAAAARQATELVQRMFSDRGNLESVLLREPRMFFFPMGKSFPIDAPREYDAQLSNPFGGPGLPAHGVLRVDWVDGNNGLAAVTMDQNLHPDSARIVIESLMAKIPPERRPKDTDLDQLKVEISDLARYTVNLRDALPERMDFERSARVPGGYRRDAVIMRRLQ